MAFIAGERQSLLAPILFALLATLWVAPPEIFALAAVAAFALLAPVSTLVLLRRGALRPGEGWLWAAVVLALGVSHLSAVDTGASLESITRLLGAMVVFLAARTLTRQEAGGLLALFLSASAILAAHGIWQYAAGFDLLLQDSELAPAVAERLRTYRVFGRFTLPSTFASFLLLSLPVVALAAVRDRGWRRLLLVSVVALEATALTLTRSHGALLALALAAAGWSLTWPRSRRGRVAATVCGVAVAALLSVAVLRQGVLLSGAEEGGPVALRLRNFAAAGKMIADHPVTGVGGGSFGSVYPSYRQPGDNETRFAHNTYLQLAAEHGLPLLLAVVVLVGAFCRRLARLQVKTAPLEVGVAFGLTVFLVHNLWDFSGMLTSTLWTAAALGGWLMGRPEDAGAPTPATVAQTNLSSALGPGRRLGATLASLGMLAVCGLGVLSGLGEGALQQAQDALRQGRVDDGLGAVRRGRQLAPWQAGPALLEAEILLRHPAVAPADGRALVAADDALRRNRAWPVAYKVRATARAGAGDAGGAAADLWRAADLYPMSENYRRELQELGEAVAGRAGREPR